MDLTELGMPGTSPENSSHGMFVCFMSLDQPEVMPEIFYGFVMQYTSKISYCQPVMMTMKMSLKMCSQTFCQNPWAQKITALMSLRQILAL